MLYIFYVAFSSLAQTQHHFISLISQNYYRFDGHYRLFFYDLEGSLISRDVKKDFLD